MTSSDGGGGEGGHYQWSVVRPRHIAPSVESTSHKDGCVGSEMISDRDREVTFLSGLSSLMNID